MEDCWDDSPKKKVKKKNPPRDCIIHVRDDVGGECVSPFTKVSWQTAFNSSKRRQDGLLSNYTNKPDDKVYGFHRKCYQTYTNSKTLKQFPDVIENDETRKSTRDKTAKPSQLAPNECVICNKRKSRGKGKSGYEELITCITEASATTLKEYTRNNLKFEAHIVQLSISEIIAKEFRYHRSCYRTLSKVCHPLNIEEEEVEEQDSQRERCFRSVVDYVNESVIDEGNVIKLADLTKMYKEHQTKINIVVKGTDNRLLKNRLINHCKEDILFFKRKEGTSELVYSEKEPTKQKHLQTNVEKIRSIGAIIKKEILESKSIFSSWPPPSEEVKSENIKIPKLLETLLKSLFTSDNKVSARITRLVQSLAQDIIYNISNSKLKTVKHTQLAMLVKRKTGSKDIVRCLNRLGHCISYDEVLRNETFIAEIEAQNSDCKSYIPRSVQQSSFATFVYDNCDHNPESLQGASMHCTNGIIIQRKTLLQNEPMLVYDINNNHSRRKSFQPIASEIAPYYQTKDRLPPPALTYLNSNTDNILGDLTSQVTDIVWMIARYQSLQNYNIQKVPSWRGFYYEVIENSDELVHLVHYLPAINDSPTKLSTVQEMLIHANSKSKAMGLSKTDLVLDHAIYAKALEVLNNPVNHEMRSTISLRMGGFHACCIFLAVIGKRFGAAGLRDIIVESGLVGPGSLESVFRGKEYNHGIRITKTVSEAMFRIRFEVFQEWLTVNGNINVLQIFLESSELDQLLNERNPDTVEAAVNKFNSVIEYYQQFEEHIRQGDFGPTALLWQTYLDMSQALLDYIKSFRIGDWELQLSSMKRLLIWFHAYDRINYSRHFTYCYASMLDLPNNHPEIYQEFKKGNFATKRSTSNFNMIPPDQVIEQTINRDQKGPGGIIGFTTNIGCIQRWVLSSHVTAMWSNDFKQNIGTETLQTKPKDLQEGRKKFDEDCVQNCVNIIKHWNNPFEQRDDLIIISSGITANKEIQDDLKNAEIKGKESLDVFIKERIVEGSVPFHEVIKKKKLKTFESLTKQKTFKVKDTTVAIKADRETFARLLVIQNSQGIDIQEVLQHELSPLPLSIASANGSLLKTVKSKLFNSLSNTIEQTNRVDQNTPKIYDGMVMLQKLPPKLELFGSISDYLINKLLKGDCKCVFFVTDYYKEDSIKCLERARRSNIGVIRLNSIKREQRLPVQLKKYLQNADNKIDLIQFLINDWSTNKDYVGLFSEKELYITCETKAFKISSRSGDIHFSPAFELESNQEEADTKMFLACLVAEQNGYDSVHIVTVDTDVALLAIYYQRKLNIKIFLELGTGANTNLFDMSTCSLSEGICNTIPGLHALTGTDTTSCFSGIGKSKSLTVLQSDSRFIDAVSLLGEQKLLSETVGNVLEEFICSLYNVKNETSINKARYKLFTNRLKFPEPQKLPPTKDALYLHFRRVNYQAYEWKKALVADHEYIDPTDHGWRRQEDSSLEILWMENAPAPDVLLEFVSCNCKKSKCTTGRCSCKNLNLLCNDFCNCNECENSNKEDDEMQSDFDYDSSDEETDDD